ncbi:MAG: hypothetical protein LBM92_00830 [Opitutaceae bacterium]|jgi:hypothetical protein|nr:hypothetical protein [Opitutaceae bacterium]
MPDKNDILQRNGIRDAATAAWLKAEAPFFECPDPAFERLWYYRWALVRRHLVFVPEINGHILTEFDSDKPLYWAGPFNSIVGASDHHVNEARWLRSARYAAEYLRFWLAHPAAQRQNYSAALADSVWSLHCARGDDALRPAALLDALAANHECWRKECAEYPHDRGHDAARGLYWNTGRDSSGEYNLASAQLNEPLRGIQGYKVRGGAGYRPDINADQFADALAISRLARIAGRDELADGFARRARDLRAAVHAQLWDPARQFFLHRWRRDEYSEGDRHGAPTIRAGSLVWETNADRHGGVGHQPRERGEGRGRELTGYLPWYRGLADDTPEFAAAWRFLLDPEYFYAPYGPASAERHDPWFSIQCDCRVNGNSFPLNTSRVLNAAARLLHEHRHHGPMTPRAYFDLLSIYARTQSRDGAPYLAEFHHPDRDCWLVDRPIGAHYFHSSFCDLVITGLLGVRPRAGGSLLVRPLLPENTWDYFALRDLPWQGRLVTLLWDRTGKKYGAPGLRLFLDNQERATAPALGPALLVPAAEGRPEECLAT